MSRLFPNWLKHLCPPHRAQTWRCHLVTFHQEQAYKKNFFCVNLKSHCGSSAPFSLGHADSCHLYSFNANHGCLVQSCNSNADLSTKGMVKSIVCILGWYVFISTARYSAISFLLKNICGMILIITKQKTTVYISVQLRWLC